MARRPTFSPGLSKAMGQPTGELSLVLLSEHAALSPQCSKGNAWGLWVLQGSKQQGQTGCFCTGTLIIFH